MPGNGKIRMKRILYIILLAGWMAVIFSFSARPADESEQMSHSVGKMAGKLLIPDYHTWSEQRQEEFAARIDYPVRKGAHMTEFAILGMLLSLAAGTVNERQENAGTDRRRAAAVVMAGILYAVSDEVHQLFVPGRSCQVTDVMIDSCGVILGVFFVELARRYYSGSGKHAKKP